MNKDRGRRPQPQGEAGGSLGRFEYDRADEKRKIQEEIEDILDQRQERNAPRR